MGRNGGSEFSPEESADEAPQRAPMTPSPNDVLAHRDASSALMARGIDYVPDFLVNSGGVIAIYAARSGWDTAHGEEAVHSIGDRVREILEQSRRGGRTPLEVAEQVASDRLGHRVRVPD